MQITLSRFGNGMILTAALVLSTACGRGNQFVQDVKVKAYTENNDVYGEVRAHFDSGNLRFPAITLPVVNPKRPAELLGSLDLRPVLGGGGEISLSLNLAEVARLDLDQYDTLPNGNLIPVAVPGNVPVLSLQAGAKSRVYVAFGKDVAMVGLAVSIKEFDQIGKKLPYPMDLMPSFRVGKGVTGVAGLFTSPAAGENGVALFVDASSVFNKNGDLTPPQELQSKDILLSSLVLEGRSSDPRLQVQSASPEVSSQPAQYRERFPAWKYESRIYQQLYKLDRKRQSLSAD